MLTTADEALKAAIGEGTIPTGESSNFVCPHCHAYTQQFWGFVSNLSVYPGDQRVGSRKRTAGPMFTMASCGSCGRESVFAGLVLIYPESSHAPRASGDMPREILEDFEEARLIYSRSPRGAAALLRLAIQKLCPILGATETDINKAIGGLVKAGKIPPAVQQALDSVRVIGNEAVHPGTMDLKDDHATAKSLFSLLNFIIEKAITEPKLISEIYGGLPPQKLAGIAQRDAKNKSP